MFVTAASTFVTEGSTLVTKAPMFVTEGSTLVTKAPTSVKEPPTLVAVAYATIDVAYYASISRYSLTVGDDVFWEDLYYYQ